MKIYQQKADYACGPALIRTLMEYYGLPVPTEEALVSALGSTDLRGTSIHRMRKYLVQHAHGGTVKVIDDQSIDVLVDGLQNKLFQIIDWADWGGHYVMVIDFKLEPGWAGGRFTLADPAAAFENRPDGRTYACGERLKSLWFDPIPPASRGLCLEVPTLDSLSPPQPSPQRPNRVTKQDLRDA